MLPRRPVSSSLQTAAAAAHGGEYYQPFFTRVESTRPTHGGEYPFSSSFLRKPIYGGEYPFFSSALRKPIYGGEYPFFSLSRVIFAANFSASALVR